MYSLMENEDLNDLIEITDCSESEDEDDVAISRQMEKLLETFPALSEHFEVHGLVGEGTFSNVYSATLLNQRMGKRFAIKHIIPTCHPDKIKFELECLKNVGGCNNVVGIHMCLRNDNNVIFVMPYQQHHSFSEFVGEMDSAELALYMKNLLIALARVHKFKIIHRDIKPSNFLYNRNNKSFLLVDFGLAQKQSDKEDAVNTTNMQKISIDPLSPVNRNKLSNKSNVKSHKVVEQVQKENKTIIAYGQKKKSKSDTNEGRNQCSCYGKAKVCTLCMAKRQLHASRAGTPGFRPPEVLFKKQHQTTAVDIWAAGIMLLSILSKCNNFFMCPDDHAAITELVTMFGYVNVKKIAEKFGRYFICSANKPELDLRKICCTLRARGERLKKLLNGDLCERCGEFQKVCLCVNVPLNNEIKDCFTSDAYDLLRRLLDLDPQTRITAEQALKHEFLKDV